MSKTIWHVGAWANNVGDRVLQESTQSLFRNYFSEHVRFVSVNCQQTYFSEALINKINANADLLLIGGGGLLFHRPMDSSCSGWQFNIQTNNIKKISVPVVVYGIGFNKFPHDNHIFPDSMWENLSEVINKSSLFSVRNIGTKNTIISELSKNNFSINKEIDIVPDAGMFIGANEFGSKVFDNPINIGLNWATDRPEQRFGNYDSAVSALNNTLNMIKSIAEYYDGAKVFVIEHLTENDLNRCMKNELHLLVDKILGSQACVISREFGQELYPPFDYNAGFFADIYKKMNVVFGARGHANIIPFGQNTPFIGIGEHNKVSWFLKEIGMDNNFIDLKNSDSFDAGSEIAKKMIEHPNEYKTHMTAELKRLHTINEEFIKKVVSLV